ncbi:MAG TPA: alpha/beta fold hydrolase [Actinophytocola sp.]|jgi:pimeloyl-ACP methyl ester carboxylesterase|uniref:alpha/beta hydrolase n=1 Tax=Actinophytocola sp. TaxID=1872138 RepID=UPI002E00F85A|nr:alpha/beta fold hydrolase [Actinophytocola sp.]
MRPLKVVAASLIVVLAGALGTSPVTAAPEISCTETDLSVTLTLLPQNVHGKLCRPVGGVPTMVQLLVHGGTYNGQYWDLPYDSGRYSYQRDMAGRGLATFAIDLPGSGASSQPLSALITGTGLASVVHQVAGKLRSGKVSGTRFDRVILVGHSMGSGIAALAAATYRDVDGVILTGFSHSMDLLALTGIFVDAIQPAPLDPVLGARGSDPGYVTTIPGTRNVFYDPGAVEPGVLTADEATKDQVAATVVPDLVTLAFTSTLTRSITAPVLIANGERDTLFCAFHCTAPADLTAAESPYFTSRLDVFLLPQTGHSLALSPTAPTYRAAVTNWITTQFGQ